MSVSQNIICLSCLQAKRTIRPTLASMSPYSPFSSTTTLVQDFSGFFYLFTSLCLLKKRDQCFVLFIYVSSHPLFFCPSIIRFSFKGFSNPLLIQLQSHPHFSTSIPLFDILYSLFYWENVFSSVIHCSPKFTCWPAIFTRSISQFYWNKIIFTALSDWNHFINHILGFDLDFF